MTLLPPAYVRPYVRRNKTDRTDAEAIPGGSALGEIPSRAGEARGSRRWSRCIGFVSSGWPRGRRASMCCVGSCGSKGCCSRPARAPALQRDSAILEDAETSLRERTLSP